MGWCCRFGTSQKSFAGSYHSSHQISISFCWPENSLEGNPHVWSSWYRKNVFSKGLRNWNAGRNILQHFCLGLDVKICWLIIKDSEGSIQFGKEGKAEHHLYWLNWLYCRIEIILIERGFEKSENRVFDSDAGCGERLQRCLSPRCY